jgi:hypothetical protein
MPKAGTIKNAIVAKEKNKAAALRNWRRPETTPGCFFPQSCNADALPFCVFMEMIFPENTVKFCKLRKRERNKFEQYFA